MCKESNLYLNRELSWLEFNKRVLNQAYRKDIPLLERFKFLAISASNLDEFIMVRCGKLLSNVETGGHLSDFDGMPYSYTLEAVKDTIIKFKNVQTMIFNVLREEIKESNVLIKSYSELSSEEKKAADKIFVNKIEPLIISTSIDSTKEEIYTDIKSKKTYIWAYAKENITNTNCARMLYFELNNDFFDYMYNLGNFNGQEVYITTENLVISKLQDLYPEEKILAGCSVRFLRSAHYEFDNLMDRSMTEKVEELLSTRESNGIISFEIGETYEDSKKSGLKKIVSEFKSLCEVKEFRFETKSPLDLSKFMSLGKIVPDNYKITYKENKPQFLEDLIGYENMFDAIDVNEDIVLHHPFHSYKPVVQLIEDAAKDKDVVIIQQTIYRASSVDSPIINALCEAAESGKKVRVLLELKARFDEGQNMEIREKLKNAGCIVIYCKSDIKTHAKCLVIVRRNKNKINYYSHIGTGNYNEKTAEQYTDLSYITNDKDIGRDIMMLFNKLATSYDPTNVPVDKIRISPTGLRKELEERIEKEIENVKNGKEGEIIFKLNSLSDKSIIDKLYKASNVGVRVTILCRGICSMKPINDNITIKSIIGRYLEHSRIYYFYNDGKENVFISSADCLRRNLDRRIEILLPIKYKMVKTTILNILRNYLEDTDNTYMMNKSGEYDLVKSQGINIHELLFQEAYETYLSRSVPKFKKTKTKK